MSTQTRIINTTKTLPLWIGGVAVAVIALALLASTENSADPQKKIATKQQLLEVDRNYKQNFREGCTLDQKTSLRFNDGTGISAYFAKCKNPYPQKEYTVGEFMGLNAVYEKDVISGSLFPIIVISPQNTDLSSSSVTAFVIGKLQKQYVDYLSKLSETDAKKFADVDVSFQPMKGAFIMYQIPQGKGKGAYFDRSSIELTGSVGTNQN